MRTVNLESTGRGGRSRAARVVKVGGRELVPGPGLDAFASWVAETARAGVPLVVVHGGGDEVTALADRLGVTTEKVEGQRVTTPEVLPLVEGVLAGQVNLRLVAALVQRGVKAIGLTGVSGAAVEARTAQEGRLGLVGEPTTINVGLVEQFLETGFVPVFAPLASDGTGGVLNVNADLFAEAVARSLGGELMLVTDVDGVLGPSGTRLGRVTPSTVEALISDGTVHVGMVPKVEAAVRALSGGLSGVWIGRLTTSASSPMGIEGGTWIVPETQGPGPAVPETPVASRSARRALQFSSGPGPTPPGAPVPVLPHPLGAGEV
jgi:acetylglutamate kinase